MATPNYGFEKRQRELAKKQKKEEKLRAKAERKHHGDGATEDQMTSDEQSPSGSGSAPDGAAQS